LGTTNSAMAVMEGGRLAKSEYRKFKIQRKKGNDDTGNLKEILRRRFKHQEWQKPNLIVVDGGVAQVNAAKSVLQDTKFTVPVVGVVKDNRHKVSGLIGIKSILEKYKDDIITINADTHRFAITFHRKKRSESFL